MAREPLILAAVGKRGVGKSYQTMKLMQQYVMGNPSKGVPPRRVLIMDVNDEYYNIEPISLADVSLYSLHPKMEIRRIRPLRPDGSRMGFDEWAQALFYVLQRYYNGFLLIEDVNKFVGDYLPNDLVGAICTNRHVGVDIMLHYQAIGRLTPKIWQNLNVLRFHKNSESVDRHEKKFPEKYEFLKIAENMVESEYYAGNTRFFLTVNLDTEKIRGTFSKELFIKGMNEYIAMYQNALVKPYLNKLDERGRKMYDNKSALEAVR
jgi:hypothetical protein